MTLTPAFLNDDSPSRRPIEKEPLSSTLSIETAALLRQNHVALTERWAARMQSLCASYGQRSLDEIKEKCRECLLAYEALLAKDDPDPLWQFIDHICQFRAEQQFPPADIAEAIALFQDAADEVLGAQVNDLESWRAVSAELRNCTRATLRAFANSYWIHVELAQTGL